MKEQDATMNSKHQHSTMTTTTTTTLKFLCSYGGKILPRKSDGKLRYVGGFTRILSVDRSISYAEMMVKLVEFCGFSVVLKCQLPNGDLETLISIKSDEDLANLVEEYDKASRLSPSSLNPKIRAILFPPKSLKTLSPPLSKSSSRESSNYSSRSYRSMEHQSKSPPVRAGFSGNYRPALGKLHFYPCYVRREPRVSYGAAYCNCCH